MRKPTRGGREEERRMRYIDDIRPGERIELGTHTFTAEAIKAFAQRFDPQPFHLDPAAAARALFGRVCASGWHTAAVWVRLLIEHHRRVDEALRASGRPVAEGGPALGFRNLRWAAPVYAGDTVAYAFEVIETRSSASRPGWGLMTLRGTGVNQDGAPVLSFTPTAFVQARPR